MIIKKDNDEEELVFKYFCDIENKKQKIIGLFNDNYVKYFSSSELHQYYLFVRQINYIFDYLESLYSQKSLSILFEKGENELNILRQYIFANNKELDKVSDEKIKTMSLYDLEKNIINYGKKTLKYYKYVLNIYNLNYKYDKDKIFDCIKIRLHLSIIFNLLNKQYESNLYLYSSFMLLSQYFKNKTNKKNNQNPEENIQEKEIIDFFNKIKDTLYPNIKSFPLSYNQKLIKEIKRKIKYHLNNSIEFILLYNQQNEELNSNIQTKGGQTISLKGSSNKKFFDFFSFPSIILKIYKSIEENAQIDEKLKTKIKLYEIYSDALTYYKREQYNIFFKCLSQNYTKKDSLLSYDGKNITTLKIDHSKLENILSKYDFLPSDIAQLFNLIGVALMLLFRRNMSKEDNNDAQIKLFKKHKEKAFMIFNAGLNDNLMTKAKELDLALNNRLNLNLENREKNYLFSLVQIRNCIRINISKLLIIKDFNKSNQFINLIDTSLYKLHDFPINYALEKQKEFLRAIYLDSINTQSNEKYNYFNNNILNIFPNIKNYLPCLKKQQDEMEFLNYYIDLNDIDEFDLINALMSNSNNEAFKKNLENFITPQNFKEKFCEYYNNSTGEEKELFNNILNKEHLGNISFWNKKFDYKQGKGFLFNPIYMNYISKYYNFKINLFYIEDSKNKLVYLNSISLGVRKYSLNLICDKNINQIYKAFIPLINKNEILHFVDKKLKNYLNNLLKRAEEYNDLFPHFSNLLLWQIVNTIKITLINDNKFNELNDEEIFELYLNCMFKLGLNEQIIHFINENINTILKNDKKYYILLFNCYKRLCLYDNCIDAIKQYLFENKSSDKKLNYENIQNINDLQEKDFIDIYNYYKNLEKERPIIFVPPLMDDDLFQILNDKYKNHDDNIFNLEAQLFEEKIEINQKAKLQQGLEKLKSGNKFKILCIEGSGIKSLIQIFFLCEIENYLQKPISQIFDCIVTSRDGLFLCGLLTTQNEKGEVKYHANDVLKIFNKQKETIYNNNLKKELKIDLLRKIFNLPEIIGNLYYYDERCQAMLKIGNNDLIIDLFENYLDMSNNKNDNSKESIISLNHILRVIPKNIKKDNLYLLNLGNGIYPFNNSIEDVVLKEHFFMKQILGEHYLYLDIPLNTCKDEGKFSLQSLDNQFSELFSNCIEYFSEIRDNNALFTDKLDKFFTSNNS